MACSLFPIETVDETSSATFLFQITWFSDKEKTKAIAFAWYRWKCCVEWIFLEKNKNEEWPFWAVTYECFNRDDVKVDWANRSSGEKEGEPICRYKIYVFEKEEEEESELEEEEEAEKRRKIKKSMRKKRRNLKNKQQQEEEESELEEEEEEEEEEVKQRRREERKK